MKAQPLIPMESPTESRPPPRAARCLSIFRSESTITPRASAQGFLVRRTPPGPWTRDSLFATRVGYRGRFDPGVRDPTPFDARSTRKHLSQVFPPALRVESARVPDKPVDAHSAQQRRRVLRARHRDPC